MSRVWVCNASPLILLGKINRVALLGDLSDVLVIPEAVTREVGAKPEGDRVISEIASLPGTRFEPEITISVDLAGWNLGRGESQVLALAAASPSSRAVLDDLEARRCAQTLGVPMIGTLGVVLRAKRKGVIDKARPVIEHLRQVGLYASDLLIERALAHLGE
jgi:predicted nucleic acid-binding protein